MDTATKRKITAGFRTFMAPQHTFRRKRKMSFPQFDAELDETVCDRYTNADLTLTMRIGFNQVNPSGGAATGTYANYGETSNPSATQVNIKKWTPGSWARFKQNIVQSAQRFWHGKFWLVNTFPILEFYDPKQLSVAHATPFRHNIYCRFKLIGADKSATAGAHHHVIDAVRLANPADWFGSTNSIFDSSDTRYFSGTRADSRGKFPRQQEHVHEIGHLLGFGHSGQGHGTCPLTGNTNAPVCYGSTDAEMHSIMGGGMRLYPEHAYPWRRAAAAITGKGVVRTPSQNRQQATNDAAASAMLGRLGMPFTPSVPSTDWTPKMKRHYPRTPAEVARGAAITRRPNRG